MTDLDQHPLADRLHRLERVGRRRCPTTARARHRRPLRATRPTAELAAAGVDGRGRSSAVTRPQITRPRSSPTSRGVAVGRRRGRTPHPRSVARRSPRELRLVPADGARRGRAAASRTPASSPGSPRACRIADAALADGRADARRAADRGRRPRRAGVPHAPRSAPTGRATTRSSPAGPTTPPARTTRPDARTIVEGDTVIIDVGALVDGYHSDMTRTFVVGEPTPEQLEIYDLVLEAQLRRARRGRAPASPAATSTRRAAT